MARISFGNVAENLRRSTVLVRSGRRGCGSGVIWRDSSSIVTNDHVIQSRRISVELWNGQSVDASIEKADLRRDLAVLKIPESGIQAPATREARHCRPGELVVAIGNPLGFIGALSTGVIYQVGPLRGIGRRTWVQSTARLAPGNSGGPLADAEGRVIGINAMVAGGVGLAIPSEEVAAFLGGQGDTAWLGVTAREVRIPLQSGAREGVLILETEENSPAERASLLPGDVLVELDGKEIRTCEELAEALGFNEIRVIRVGFLRGDNSRLRHVAVQIAPERAAAA